MISLGKRVCINLPGRYNGETGSIVEIIPLQGQDSKAIYKVKIDCCIYDPIETLLVYEDDLLLI